MTIPEQEIRLLLTSEKKREAVALIKQSMDGRIKGYMANALNDKWRAEEALARFNALLWDRLVEPGLPEDLSVRDWVYRIAREARRQTTRSEQKRRQRIVTLPAEPANDSEDRPSRRMQLHQELVELERVRALLTDEERELLALTYSEGMSAPEVAKILDISSATVRQRLTRVRSKLRYLYATPRSE
jgi:RNA polymerase sigma factor (sigma-70 family)